MKNMITIETLKQMQEHQGLLSHLLNREGETGVYIDKDSFPYVKVGGLKGVISKVLLTYPIEKWKKPEMHKFLMDLSYELEDVSDEITMGELT
jgi:hypothetical protein